MVKPNKPKRNLMNKVGAVLLVSFFGLFFLLLTIHISKLMLTQKASGVDLVREAQKKHFRETTNSAERGKIFDRDGDVIAEDKESYRLVAIVSKQYKDKDGNPLYIQDIDKASKKISDILDVEKEDIYDRLKKGQENGNFQVEFGKAGQNLSFNQKKALESSKLTGITFMNTKKRFYPNGLFAPHLVGFAEMNSKTKQIEGQLGAEKVFNSYLQGDFGKTEFNKDIWGTLIPDSTRITSPQKGGDISLTLDKNIQYYTENALDHLDKLYEPKSSFAYVVDAKTGEILAGAQRPAFNPKTREGFGASWVNALYQQQIEPGSTFKVFGLAAAIEEGVYERDKTYMSGHRTIGNHTIYDWNQTGWGQITYNEGLQHSSNVLMMRLQDEVGTDKMKMYYDQFGFGKPTGGLYNGEIKGQVPWEKEIQKKTTAFGQTITVTPAQMLKGMTSIVNNGEMLKPYYVKKIEDEHSVLFKAKPETEKSPISKETSEKTRRELTDVVNGNAAGENPYKLEEYKLAGKTGTAQVLDEENGGYVKGNYQYLTSFIGYAPADNPEVIIYMAMKQAQKDPEKVFNIGVSEAYKPLMLNTLKYREVKSNTVRNDENDTKQPSGKMPNVVGMTQQAMHSKLDEYKLNIIEIGNGDNISKQSIKKGQAIAANDTLFIQYGDELTMPNLSELSKRNVIEFSEMTQLNIEIEGSGYVDNQSVSVGQSIKPSSKIKVKLKPRH